ncbi:MAG: UDP-N-acetylmuramate dehydrogenase [Chloroflexi bacterium]|nr:UDP-N-acetylmuramate dehydrogenase [Chloroflexota bacterium]
MITVTVPLATEWPFQLDLKQGQPLSAHTYLGVGGPAENYVEVSQTADLIAVLDHCHRHDIPVLVIGEGSNLLVGDKGVRGLVVRNVCREIRDLNDGRIQADSGVLMGRLAHWCAARGYAGLEFGVGIPGTVGGSVFGNAGCFGTEMADILESADVWTAGDLTTMDNQSLQFGYRYSKLRHTDGNPVVVSAILRRRSGDAETSRRRITDLSRRRRETQPAARSAGSVFKNPPGDYAGSLIDRAGLKGRRRGRAVISTKHANFIVNEGGATASDVWTLIEDAKAAVRELFNVDLELEVRLVGEGFGKDR